MSEYLEPDQLIEAIGTAFRPLLGTDFPFIPEPGMTATIAGLRQVGLDEAAVQAIEGENAASIVSETWRGSLI